MALKQDIEIIHLPIDDLKPDPANPRRISDEELESLTRSIREFGMVDPIIARAEDKQVIGGHQRLLAARRLGIKTVPVVLADLSPEQAHLLNLALNRISGSWDQELLARLLSEMSKVPDVDLTLSSFTDDELRKHLKSLESREIHGRWYLAWEDYLGWRGRRVKGDLRSGVRQGLVVSCWNLWVEAQDGPGKAALAEVPVSKLDCHAQGYPYHEFQDTGDLEREIQRRRSILDDLWLHRPGSRAEASFRVRVEKWRELARDFLLELCALRHVIDSVSRRYFEGQQTLFPKVAESFEELVSYIEKLIGLYNNGLEAGCNRPMNRHLSTL